MPIEKLGKYSIRENGGGMIITLPKTWCILNRIKKGDKVIMFEDDGILIIEKAPKTNYPEDVIQ